MLERIRAIDPTAPVILSSGHALETAGQTIEDDGRTSFLQKPYQPTSLSQAIGEILESTSEARESIPV